MNTAWAVPRNRRPNPLKARARSVLILLTAGTGQLLSARWRTCGVRQLCGTTIASIVW